MTVLIVDDASTTRRAIRRALKRFLPDATVHEASSLGVARAWLLAKPIDLVLLDWTVGAATGAELLAAMGQNGLQRVPTIVVSAVTDPAAAAEARADGARAWVHKPFELDELRDTIQRVCAA